MAVQQRGLFAPDFLTMPRLNIDELDDVPQYERCESFGGGMDGYTRSTLLPLDAYQYGLNTVVPDGMELRTRPGGLLLGTARAARIQGAIYFDAAPSTEQLIVGSDSKLWHWNGSAWTEMTGWTLTDANLDFSAAQGVNTVLFTDGAAELRIWNGTTWSAALGTADTDPPQTATILLWHAGRMWAAGFPGNVAGKEDDAIWGSAQLAFGNGDWNKTDRNIRIGGGDGDKIVGLASLSSSFDKGFVMAVLKANSLWLVNTDPTVAFTNFTAQLGPEQVGSGIGLVGKRAFAVVGNDLYFVSPDHTIRNLARMASAQGQYEVSAPLSLPIQPYVDRINWTYASKIAVVKYKELVIFSVPLDASTYPDTQLVYNARLQKWVGIWTGLTANCFALTRFNDVQRLAFGQYDGKVRVLRDYQDAADDDTHLDDTTAMTTEMWLRAWLFGEPLNDKDPFHVELRFGQSNAVVTVTLVCDNVEVHTWTVDVRPTGPYLEINLDFDLVADGNIAFPRGLSGLQPFNECYLKLSATAGWFSLRNASMSAFVNTLRTE